VKHRERRRIAERDPALFVGAVNGVSRKLNHSPVLVVFCVRSRSRRFV
jgi:hypothetical protein